MLDTHARRLVEPLIARVARGLKAMGFSADTITVLAMLVGVTAALCIALDWPWLGIGILWLSGLLDATDGALARMTHASPLGAIMDITFDRVVEMAVIVALAWRFPDAHFLLLILAGAITVAMSLFLSIGAAIRNTSAKSFHYAPGLGERTEAFICLTLMVADSRHLVIWTGVFIAMIGYTMIQRFGHAARLLSSSS